MSDSEKLLPLPAAVEQVTGQRPHPSTLHRWRIRGISGVKLETVKLGGRRLCSVEAVRRFMAETTAAVDGVKTPQRTNRQRDAAIAKAERELDSIGI